MIEASQVISDEVNIGSISTYREISLSLMKKIAGSVAELLMNFRRESACAQQTRRRNVSARVY